MKVLERTRQQFYRSESFAMKTDILMNGSSVKNHISFKTGFEYNVIRRTSFRSWFPACHRVLHSSHPSTPMTPSSQEIDHPTSSSSSSTSPTTTVLSDSETREREDLSGMDSYPVPVSSSNVEEMIERGDPLWFRHPRVAARIQKKI